MPNQISTGAVHHYVFTVTDVNRASNFYTSLLGFHVVMDLDPAVLLSNGSVLLTLKPPSDPEQAISDDAFNENRVGLDHVSLSVDSYDELDQAVHLLDERGVPHGEIKDLGPDLGIHVLAFRDPDNIQIELTATYS